MNSFRDIKRFCSQEGKLWLLAPLALLALCSLLIRQEDEHTSSPFIYVQT